MIIFVGSVFSPWYFSRISKGERPKPSEHCAVNVALTSKRTGASRWIFTEYDRFDGELSRGITIGKSSLSKRTDGVYELSLEDRPPAYALPMGIKGRVRFTSDGPTAVPSTGPFVLDRDGAHRWAPVAPRCRVDVDLSAPNLRFSGDGYHDVNHGDEPLGAAFSRWHWARSHERDRTRIRYDRALRDGTRRVLDIESDRDGLRYVHRDDERAMKLAMGAWTLMEPAALHVDSGPALTNVRRVESSPFYARYTARTQRAARGREHLDLDRFALPSMQRMLPFRARRDAR